MKLLPGIDAYHVRNVGLDSLQNGELLTRANSDFDVLVTVDKSMPFQQSLKGKRISVIVLDVPDVELSTYERFVPSLRESLQNIGEGEFQILGDPLRGE